MSRIIQEFSNFNELDAWLEKNVDVGRCVYLYHLENDRYEDHASGIMKGADGVLYNLDEAPNSDIIDYYYYDYHSDNHVIREEHKHKGVIMLKKDAQGHWTATLSLPPPMIKPALRDL